MHDTSRVFGTPLTSGVLSYEKLNDRITTRVLATKILKQRECEEDLKREKSLTTQSSRSKSSMSQQNASRKTRRPSKFLSGAAVPNSTIKSESQNANMGANLEDKNAVRAQRDASVKEILQRLETRFGFSPENYFRDVGNRENANIVTVLENNYKMEESILDISFAKKSTGNIVTWDTVKQRERISRRTAKLAPLNSERQPTYESIRHAIQNSQQRLELMNADKLENERIGRSQQDQIAHKSKDSSLMEIQDSATTKMISKSSRTSRKSLLLTENSKKLKLQNKRKKSILKRGSNTSKPTRNVSILENRMEDSETQTLLRMNDFD